jgi:hypothetical protein
MPDDLSDSLLHRAASHPGEPLPGEDQVMGFSLKSFFEELEQLIQNAKSAEDLEAIRQFVAREKQYADDCGHLR